MEKLSDDQLKDFDTEYVNDRRWIPVQRCIDRDFPDGRFTFLDVGGGSGLFADRILANYPHSEGVVLDNSGFLLDKNSPSSRKHIVLDSVENLSRNLADTKFDIVFFNWLMHHLIARSSYSRSRKNIDMALRSAKSKLTKSGRISIYENMYDGLFIDGAPSWIIYRLTSARSIAGLARKGGSNTAGVGVCPLSYRQWCSTIRRNDLRILDYAQDEDWIFPWGWKVFLHIGHVCCGCFWLRVK